MTTMLVPPIGMELTAQHGAVMTHAGKYAKHAVLTAFDMLGGVSGLATWANQTAANKADFYTKLFPKVIEKSVEINDQRSIEDVLAAIDGEFTVVENPLPSMSAPATQFGTGFAPPNIVLGVDEDEELPVE